MSLTTMTIDHLGGKRYVGHNEAGDQIIVDGEDVAPGISEVIRFLQARMLYENLFDAIFAIRGSD